MTGILRSGSEIVPLVEFFSHSQDANALRFGYFVAAASFCVYMFLLFAKSLVETSAGME